MKLIAAVTKNYGVGFNNDLLFKFKSDLAHFKQMTLDKACIMGYNTFMSLPIPKGQQAPLPGRQKVVLCNKSQVFECVIRGADAIYTEVTQEFLDRYSDAFVIGGPYCWKSLASYIDTMYITYINAKVPADAYFPEKAFNINDSSIWSYELLRHEKENNINLAFVKHTKV